MYVRGEARLREVTTCETDAEEAPDGWQGRAIRKFILAMGPRRPWLWGTPLRGVLHLEAMGRREGMGKQSLGSELLLCGWDDAGR